MRMRISLTFTDLAKLLVNGKVETDGSMLSVSRPSYLTWKSHLMDYGGFVRFTVDESRTS
jgi:hypothetical protein